MEITESVLEKDVIDYDFTLVGGLRMPMTIEAGIGDSATEEADRWIIHLTAKPRPTDPDDLMPEEHIHLYKRNVIGVIIRPRKQRVPDPEEVFNMRKTLHALAKQVQ